jgi:predicted dehydrogenase
VNMICFNYRRAPAIQLAKKLIDEGRLGEIRHWRAVYLQDWALDPQLPLIWRFRREMAGSGSLGDLGAHLIDLAHFLVGSITEVIGTAETFIEERPLLEQESPAAGETEMGRVTIDDAVAFLVRFASGAIGTFEATRLAPGRKAYESFEINGSNGSLSFNLERMNELQVYFADELPEARGFRTILVTEPEHPYVEAWWPPGHILGYEHTFIHTVKDLMDGIRIGKNPAPTFRDGYRCQAVLDAVERSMGRREWTKLEA